MIPRFRFAGCPPLYNPLKTPYYLFMYTKLKPKLEELEKRLNILELSQQSSTRALFDIILATSQEENISPEKLIDILESDEYVEYRRNFIKKLKEQAPELLP